MTMEDSKSLKNYLFDLINIDSSSNEAECARYLENTLREFGYDVRRQQVDKGRWNLLAGSENPKLVLAAHMDTVGFSDTSWAEQGLNPLRAEEKDGKIYGRGSVDMKAGIAVMLKLAEEVKDVMNYKAR